MSTANQKPLVLENDLDEERQQRYLASRFLAVDTETLGLQVPRDRLCVVQMCNEEGLVTLVRPGERTAPRLQEVLEAPQVEKIFHFARFDLAALKHWLGIEVNPVFCTKVASKLARTYTGSHGLKDVVREITGIELDKQQQSSDWAAEILTDQQIAYATSDVLHLVAIRERLTAMLKRENRLDLAQKCMAFLPSRADLDLAGWQDEDIFSHR
ncbi:MAG: ribonuclease D [Magnetococcales bacterium]|nr:ribonuclease D [Magnetococcales bacterium]